MEKVSLVDCKSYEMEEVYIAVKEAICRIDFEIPKDKTVLIKPNIMTQNFARQHTITHYAVVDALCRILKEKNCEVIIGESIAFYQNGLTMKAFRKACIDDVASEYDASLIAFEERPLVRIDEGLTGLKELFIPQILLEVDMVINVCKLKTHGSMRLSGAVKNMFGCLPGGYKQRIHRWIDNEFELSDVIIDIHNIVKPALSIMDAVVGLDGGPTALGRPVKVSKILASTNAAALDFVAGKMIGYKVEELPILIQAKRRGMIENFEDIQVLGEPDYVKFDKLVKKDVNRKLNKNSIFVKNTYVNPSVDAYKCIQCGECVDACPTYAITESNGKIVVDMESCINCYYCISVCNEQAIKIKASPLNILMRAVRLMIRI